MIFQGVFHYQIKLIQQCPGVQGLAMEDIDEKDEKENQILNKDDDHKEIKQNQPLNNDENSNRVTVLHPKGDSSIGINLIKSSMRTKVSEMENRPYTWPSPTPSAMSISIDELDMEHVIMKERDWEDFYPTEAENGFIKSLVNFYMENQLNFGY